MEGSGSGSVVAVWLHTVQWTEGAQGLTNFRDLEANLDNMT